MKKLITKYKANPTIKTAVAVLKYARQHPMVIPVWGYELGEVNAFYNKVMGG